MTGMVSVSKRPDLLEILQKQIILSEQQLPKKLYHASPFADQIKKQGFKSGRVISVLGGATSIGAAGSGISFTDKVRATRYAEAMQDMILASKGEIKSQDLKQFAKKWKVKFDSVDYKNQEREALEFAGIEGFIARSILGDPIITFLRTGKESEDVEWSQDQNAKFVVFMLHSFTALSKGYFPWFMAEKGLVDLMNRMNRFEVRDVEVIEVETRTGAEFSYKKAENEWRVAPENVKVIGKR